MLLPDPTSRVQRAILREYLTTGSTLARLFDLGVALLFWPLRSTLAAWRLSRSVGRLTDDLRSPSSQFIHQLYLAWFHGISPSMYYQMGVVRSKEMGSPMAWIQAGQVGLLARVFRKDKSLFEINDKRLFNAVLERGSVPRLQLIATLSRDQLARPGWLDQVVRTIDSEQSLFLKPLRGRGGQGSMVLVRSGPSWEGYRCVPENSEPVFRVETRELVKRLSEHPSGRAWLLQRRASNHPELRAIFGEALVCIRVVSGICGDEVTFLGSVLCFGAADSIISQNGLTVSVDLESGRLGQAFHSSESQDFLSRNPENGHMIEGVILPDWARLLDTVIAAHRRLSDYPFLGWDMALTNEGPLVIEANGNFGTGAMQKPEPKPMIDDRFLSVFDYWQSKIGVKV
jgi:hypothetical protein